MVEERCCPVVGMEADVEFVDANRFAEIAEASDQFGYCGWHKLHWMRCGNRLAVGTPSELMAPSKLKLSADLLALLEGYAG